MPEESRPISVGATSQPLVTSADTSVLSTPAIEALSDAFRKGFITTDEISNRIGNVPVAQAKRKAELQSLQQAGSPEALAAQQAAIQAQAARANLETAQAQAAAPLVPAQAAVTEEGLRRQQAEQQYGTGVQAFMQLAPMIPGYSKPPTDENGKLDYSVMGAEGNYLQSQFTQKQIAAQNLLPNGPPITVHTPKGDFRQQLNKLGEDISEGSPKFAYYQKILSQPYSFHAWSPESVSPGTAVTAPTVSPKTEATTPAQTEKPSIEPTAPESPAGKFTPGLGVQVSTGETPPEPNAIMDEVRKQKPYEAWSASSPFFGAMEETMNKIRTLTPEQQRSGKYNLNAKDIELVSNFIKLYDPNAVVREFKWDKIEHSQPLPDVIKNYMQTILRTGHLTPEARESLFESATDAYNAKSKAVIPYLQTAVNQANYWNKQTGGSERFSLDNVLSPQEQKLVQGLGLKESPMGGVPTASPAASGPTVNIPGIGLVRRGADGKYYRAQ